MKRNLFYTAPLLVYMLGSSNIALSQGLEAGSADDGITCNVVSNESTNDSFEGFSFSRNATAKKYLWYSNTPNIRSIYPIEEVAGAFSDQQNNPDSSVGTDKVALFQRNGDAAPMLRFATTQAITTTSDLSIALKVYVDQDTADFNGDVNRISLCLQRSEGNAEPLCREQLANTGKAWETLNFDFSNGDVDAAGGYNQLALSFTSGNDDGLTTAYYIDSLAGTSIQSPASPLAGSWGITFPMRIYTSPQWDFRGGAQEIVTKLPTTGHIITNLTWFAHGQYFTLRNNPNVDIATEIHPDSVPSEADEQIIIDVLKTFRDAGKKTILYIALDGYHNFNATEEMKAAWKNYYETKFAGDEYAAYKNLMMGFISRTKDMADGYWLDHTTKLPAGGTLDDFIASIREVHPGAMISANDTKAWLKTGPKEWVRVDTDGLDDPDPTDYLIVTHESRNTRSDFTNGHVTPIGQGAPVNSWAYEEFTIPNMMEAPWSVYADYATIKHAWFPVRERWHVPQKKLVAELEQAYRFVRRVIDADAAITWATTTEYRNYKQPGHLMPDEMEIMQEIDHRLRETPAADYIPYARPEGAYLVGEERCQ